MMSLRSIALAIGLISLVPVSGAQGVSGGTIFVRPSWHQKITAAQIASRQKEWGQAAVAAQDGLEQLAQTLRFHPDAAQQLETDRFILLKTLGKALLRNGKPELAIVPLREAVAIEDREIRLREATGDPGKASISTSEALATFQAAVSMTQSAARYMNRQLMPTTMGEGLVEELLTDRLPETNLTMLDLAEAYVHTGQQEAAYAVFDGPFQTYLKRQSSHSNPAALLNLDVAVETVCLRMGVVLAKLGKSSQADRAFECALDMSAKNFVALGLGNTVGLFMEAFAERRRLFLGAYASYLLHGDGASLDKPQQRELIGLIAETKGISGRYRERRRAIWTHSRDSAFFRGRQAFVEHDRQLTRMDVGGNPTTALQMWSMWINEESRLMAEHHEAFRRAGLQNVFVPGSLIVDRAQALLRKKSGEGQAPSTVFIGYAIYRPVDFGSEQLATSRVLRYVIAENSAEVRDLGDVASLNAQARRWRSEVISGRTHRDKASSLRNETALSQRLLGGLPPEVHKAEQWVIDPDGVLSLLPFEALPDPGSSGDRVIDHHTLRYVTSIAGFADAATQTKTSPASNRAVIVGDPVFSYASASTGKTMVRELRTGSGKSLREIVLKPLPDTREESLKVASSLRAMGVRSQVHLGKEASPRAFRFDSAPRFLHVATHGLFLEPGIALANGGSIPLASVLPGMQAALALSPEDTDDQGSGFMTGADITQLNLAGTELVVFSACDTGNGEVVAGEGIVSLRRSVEEAGARSSITSLWPVPSASTADLMVSFYESLSSGLSKAEALRQAKLSVMKTAPAPLHWAGFLLAGEP